MSGKLFLVPLLVIVIDALKTEPRKDHRSILLIGDSQMERTYLEVCNTSSRFGEFERFPLNHSRPKHLINRAILKEERKKDKKKERRCTCCRVPISDFCTNGTFTVSFFPIFGMNKPCDNGDCRVNTDSRTSNDTRSRLRQILPVDYPYLANVTDIVIGSALWDLSLGCHAKGPVSKEFAESYGAAIPPICSTLREIAPKARLAWYTYPYVGPKYSNRMRRLHNNSRTNQNVKKLNRILGETTRKNAHCGVVADYYKYTMTKWPQEEQRGGDGRHYNGHYAELLNLALRTLDASTYRRDRQGHS